MLSMCVSEENFSLCIIPYHSILSLDDASWVKKILNTCACTHVWVGGDSTPLFMQKHLGDVKINVPATGRCSTSPTSFPFSCTPHTPRTCSSAFEREFSHGTRRGRQREGIIYRKRRLSAERTEHVPLKCDVQCNWLRAEEDPVCSWQSPSTLSFQGSFPGNLQLVLVLRPTTLLQRTLSDILFKFNKDEFKMKVPVRSVTLTSDLFFPLWFIKQVRSNLLKKWDFNPHSTENAV